jgi:hypothetical protein
MADFRYWSDDVVDDFGNQIAMDWLPHEEGENDEFVHSLTSVK